MLVLSFLKSLFILEKVGQRERITSRLPVECGAQGRAGSYHP